MFSKPLDANLKKKIYEHLQSEPDNGTLIIRQMLEKELKSGNFNRVKETVRVLKFMIKDKITAKPKFYALLLIKELMKSAKPEILEYFVKKLMDRLFLIAQFEIKNSDIKRGERCLKKYCALESKENSEYSLKFFMLLLECWKHWQKLYADKNKKIKEKCEKLRSLFPINDIYYDYLDKPEANAHFSYDHSEFDDIQDNHDNNINNGYQLNDNDHDDYDQIPMEPVVANPPIKKIGEPLNAVPEKSNMKDLEASYEIRKNLKECLENLPEDMFHENYTIFYNSIQNEQDLLAKNKASITKNISYSDAQKAKYNNEITALTSLMDLFDKFGRADITFDEFKKHVIEIETKYPISAVEKNNAKATPTIGKDTKDSQVSKATEKFVDMKSLKSIDEPSTSNKHRMDTFETFKHNSNQKSALNSKNNTFGVTNESVGHDNNDQNTSNEYHQELKEEYDEESFEGAKDKYDDFDYENGVKTGKSDKKNAAKASPGKDFQFGENNWNFTFESVGTTELNTKDFGHFDGFGGSSNNKQKAEPDKPKPTAKPGSSQMKIQKSTEKEFNSKQSDVRERKEPKNPASNNNLGKTFNDNSETNAFQTTFEDHLDDNKNFSSPFGNWKSSKASPNPNSKSNGSNLKATNSKFNHKSASSNPKDKFDKALKTEKDAFATIKNDFFTDKLTEELSNAPHAEDNVKDKYSKQGPSTKKPIANKQSLPRDFDDQNISLGHSLKSEKETDNFGYDGFNAQFNSNNSNREKMNFDFDNIGMSNSSKLDNTHKANEFGNWNGDNSPFIMQNSGKLTMGPTSRAVQNYKTNQSSKLKKSQKMLSNENHEDETQNFDFDFKDQSSNITDQNQGKSKPMEIAMSETPSHLNFKNQQPFNDLLSEKKIDDIGQANIKIVPSSQNFDLPESMAFSKNSLSRQISFKSPATEENFQEKNDYFRKASDSNKNPSKMGNLVKNIEDVIEEESDHIDYHYGDHTEQNSDLHNFNYMGPNLTKTLQNTIPELQESKTVRINSRNPMQRSVSDPVKPQNVKKIDESLHFNDNVLSPELNQNNQAVLAENIGTNISPISYTPIERASVKMKNLSMESHKAEPIISFLKTNQTQHNLSLTSTNKNLDFQTSVGLQDTHMNEIKDLKMTNEFLKQQCEMLFNQLIDKKKETVLLNAHPSVPAPVKNPILDVNILEIENHIKQKKNQTMSQESMMKKNAPNVIVDDATPSKRKKKEEIVLYSQLTNELTHYISELKNELGSLIRR